MPSTLTAETIEAIVQGEHGDSFAVLGPHEVHVASEPCVAVRAFLPDAREATVVHADGVSEDRPMELAHPDGLFEVIVPTRDGLFPYRLRVVDRQGEGCEIEDPYRFPSTLSDYDLYLMGEGSHFRNYEKLGAHLMTLGGVPGVCFAVWAPNAKRVSVVGDFNRWDGRRHPMRHHPGNGIWDLFIPGLTEGALYKFEIKSQSGEPLALKADPFAFAFEPSPRTASRVFNIDAYRWGDASWMEAREHYNGLERPVAIYEVHLGSWMRPREEGKDFLTYRELAHQLADYLTEMGYTHVELLPITEHPFYGSWGYQTIGYFAPTCRYGTPADFMYFVDHLHQCGIGVILDWVPSHFPRDPHGLVYFDGTYLYEHEDPRRGEHREWGTLIFNYGRKEVDNFLLSNALFWLERYHLDGLRVDAVASMLYLDYSRKPGEWIPNIHGGNENLEAVAFLRRLNELIYEHHPGVMTIAEESTAWPQVSRPTYMGGLGFGLKWNMGWMHDMLGYMALDPIHRSYHHNNLTFGLLYAFSENFILPLSHDEVVHGKGSLLGKMSGDIWQKFANLRGFYVYMYGQPGKKLLFMGGEFGQWREWNHDQGLDWHLLTEGPHHKGVQRLVQDLNRLYRAQPALHEVDFDLRGFEWIDCHDWQGSIVSFLRHARNPEDFMIVVCNFTPVPRYGYRIGVPTGGYYVELLNSDAAIYGGSNLGNGGGVTAEPIPDHGQPFSLLLTLPPLAGLILKPATTPGPT
ncbi:MAG: 1,4-alpha-glucan branching protein GlgB [candidate division NC10 bacterium]|nr:1,4-alpha-glucan branching protein GlgB [candidate division NC10 bacterium]MDE2321084.1 1,4-alpha-glucan branching protein GlgB [candidate division NC10 bacterium]